MKSFLNQGNTQRWRCVLPPFPPPAFSLSLFSSLPLFLSLKFTSSFVCICVRVCYSQVARAATSPRGDPESLSDQLHSPSLAFLVVPHPLNDFFWLFTSRVCNAHIQAGGEVAQGGGGGVRPGRQG